MATGSQGTSQIVHDLIKKSKSIRKGPPDRYRLLTTKTNLNEDGSVRKWTFGQREVNMKNKILLMVGETGTGKTTLINAVVNYILGVKFTDNVWFEITKDGDHHVSDQTKSQTTRITVYDVFVQNNPIGLTIIDTPGYGDTRGTENDKQNAENLYKLFHSDTGVKEIDAVCFVVKATENRLSDRQQYIFDAVLSLFGKDIENSIVMFITHSDGLHPVNALNAINQAAIPCRRNEDNEPEHFLFNNPQTENRNPKYNRALQRAWELTEDNLKGFFDSLREGNRKSLEQTKSVLIESKRLEACISNLQNRIEIVECKSKTLTGIQQILQENREKIRRNENFPFTVTKYYKQKVPIENVSWWNRYATSCSVCEENCHEYKCWFALDAGWCDVMKKNHCTVCTRKCHYNKHVRENKKYVTKSNDIKMTFKDLEKQYDSSSNSVTDNSDSKRYVKGMGDNNSSVSTEKSANTDQVREEKQNKVSSNSVTDNSDSKRYVKGMGDNNSSVSTEKSANTDQVREEKQNEVSSNSVTDNSDSKRYVKGMEDNNSSVSTEKSANTDQVREEKQNEVSSNSVTDNSDSKRYVKGMGDNNSSVSTEKSANTDQVREEKQNEVSSNSVTDNSDSKRYVKGMGDNNSSVSTEKSANTDQVREEKQNEVSSNSVTDNSDSKRYVKGMGDNNSSVSTEKSANTDQVREEKQNEVSSYSVTDNSDSKRYVKGMGDNNSSVSTEKSANTDQVREEKQNEVSSYSVTDNSDSKRYVKGMGDNNSSVSTEKSANTDQVREEKQNEVSSNSASDTKLDSEAFQNVKMEFEINKKQEKEKTSIEKLLEEELAKTEKEKSELVAEAYNTIMKLSEIVLKKDTAFIVWSLDFLILRAEETGKQDFAVKLRELRTITPESEGRHTAAMAYGKGFLYDRIKKNVSGK